jgi:type VI secretion system protein ImpC
MAEDTETQAQNGTQTEAESALDRIVQEGKMARSEEQEERAKSLVGEFVDQVMEEDMTVHADTLSSIEERIAEIDELLSKQVNEILHDDEFQDLESSWRGLSHLVFNTETSRTLKLRLFNASKEELLDDLEKAVEFDQSQLFKKIYEKEYGTFGGSPYGLLVGDYEIDRSSKDMSFVDGMASVASAAHAPFVSSPSPELFDMDSWTELDKPRDLSKIFESTELTKWRSFREGEDSRYVALTLPRMLLREPYDPEEKPAADFEFVEDVHGTDHDRYLWGNSAYALGERMTNAFAKYKWCAAIRGVEGGGLVEGLPTHTFKTDDGDVAIKTPTEVAITDRRENELSKLGFISLVHDKETDRAAFFSGQTTNKPTEYDTDEATANAALSARLPYIMASSRFAHYIKAIMRDKIGSFQSKDDVSTFLNRWINQYTLGKDDAGQELKAQYPLREARIDVVEKPSKPGAYDATVFVRPHFQLEELTASIRMVAELPEPA